MRKLVRFLLLKPVLWIARTFSSAPNHERVFTSLSALKEKIEATSGKHGFVMPFDTSTDSFIIFSDQHKGAKNGADDFMLAEANYLAALQFYNKENFHFISLGDCEELWENTWLQVKKNNTASFEAEKKFATRKAFTKIFGNHDLDWEINPLAATLLKEVYSVPVVALEGIILQTTIGDTPLNIFCTHGHQGDLQSDGNWFSKFFVSNIWAPLQAYLRINPNTPAYDKDLKTIHNSMMYEWSSTQKNLLLITGHTHQPVFESLTHYERLNRQREQALREQNPEWAQAIEIDRAKTAFFSNISHEFRTPLTLMLGPLEDLLNQPQQLSPQQEENIAATHRNAMRLFRLVNTLLDFSRIESGRIQARYEPVDLASFTQDLASGFRSLIEKAGLMLDLQVDVLRQQVFVDREMWEKIVLNLLSNAFKYTLEGKITVGLKEKQGFIILDISDTGVGIPQKELVHIFERFHRIANSAGRTHEGTGIGLSLISELVKLHHGTITVTSKEGKGSTFSVSIPAGRAHLPAAQVSDVINDSYESVLLDAYTQEAATIVENKDNIQDAAHIHEELQLKNGAPHPDVEKKPNVLLVDDNADMRAYVRRLLQPYYYVNTATNGKAALQKINETMPDLILSDIMMPEMDGVQLLKRIRENGNTSRIPVILLSARAGEEAKIEGYDEGADDYLIKPFSAKELLSRVKAQIRISRLRRNTELQLVNVFSQAPVAITITKGPTFIIEHANKLVLEIWGKPLDQVLNKPVMEALPEIKDQGFFELLTSVYTTGEPFIIKEHPARFMRNGKLEDVYLNFNYVPLRELDGSISGVIAIAHEVTELVRAKKTALQNAEELEKEVRKRTHELQTKTEEFRQQKEFVETILDSSVDLIGVYDNEMRILAFNKKCEDLFNLKKENVLGKKLHEVFPQALNVKPYFDLQKALAGEVVHNDIYQSLIPGQYLENFIIPLKNTENEIYGALAIAHDITDIVEATKKLREANEELAKSNHELEQFAYIASHDLQEPLRKIATFSELLRRNLTESKIESVPYLDKIQQSTSRMTNLIKDVLAYSRLSKPNEVFVDTDLMDILENIKTDFELLIQQKNAIIHCAQLPGIKGIPLQLHQLFCNLVSNSLKFSEKDPVITITSRLLTKKEIETLHLNPLLPYVEIVFSDNGIGFEQQYAEQIFTIFQRLNSRNSYSGTGIGLALCKKIVDNHHGTITAFGELNKGAAFSIRLPIRQG